MLAIEYKPILAGTTNWEKLKLLTNQNIDKPNVTQDYKATFSKEFEQRNIANLGLKELALPFCIVI